MAATTVHPSAIVDDGAQLGDGCRVWHWVHISGGARIGTVEVRPVLEVEGVPEK